MGFRVYVGAGVLSLIVLGLTGCTMAGPAGPKGEPGAVGTAGAQGLIYAGVYNSATAYSATSVVSYQGSSYVALLETMAVAPVGDAGSATSWSVLAQAGVKGDQGIQGVTGATGAVGLTGPMGATGLTGPAGATGPQGVAGVMGAAGPEGLPGPAGAMGAEGVTGAQGNAGAVGPQGPTGPTGATGAAGVDRTSFLQTRTWGVFGDSYSAGDDGVWQSVVSSRTGMKQVFQDARGGRTLAQAFECYGGPAQGGNPGPFVASQTVPAPGTANVYCGANTGFGETNGNTLAQNLSGVDILVVELSENDAFTHEPLGSPGDETSTPTFYGSLRWVVETILTAKPTVRLVLIAPQYHLGDDFKTYADAMVTYGNSMGVPVINMFTLSGVNAITQASLTSDSLHPTPFAYANIYGPVVAQALQQIY
jgi:hypothetical protein